MFSHPKRPSADRRSWVGLMQSVFLVALMLASLGAAQLRPADNGNDSYDVRPATPQESLDHFEEQFLQELRQPGGIPVTE